MLKWITKTEIPSNSNKLLEIKNLNFSNENIRRFSNNNVVRIKLIRKFLSVEAYDKLETLVMNFINEPKWICEKCSKVLDGDCVMCQMCLNWYDCKCVEFDVNGDNFICFKC